METETDLFWEEEIKPDLTPLIDAIFLLLIFFMVSMVFAPPMQLKVDLADAERSTSTSQQHIRLSITRTGEMELMGERVEAKELVERLQEYGAAAEQGRLTILVDRHASHGYTLQAMEAAAKGGFTRVHLATKWRPGSR